MSTKSCILIKLISITAALAVLLSTSQVTNSLLLPWEITPDLDRLGFYVYTNLSSTNSEKDVKYLNDTTLEESCFCANILTIIIIPGFGANRNSSDVRALVDAYINSPVKANIVVLDWGRLGGDRLILLTDVVPLYLIAVKNVPRVAERVAQFLAWLDGKQLLDLNKVHLIGHSLGAQMAGETGEYIQKMYPGFKLPRITGLDPAGPLYWPATPERNLEKGDAHFVDVIHVNAFLYGDTTINGHVDFFPNGGSVQPGCNLITNIGFCSHVAVMYLYAATLKTPMIACKCSMRTMDEIRFNACMEMCPSPVLMGVPTPHTARGEYFLWTKQFVNFTAAGIQGEKERAEIFYPMEPEQSIARSTRNGYRGLLKMPYSSWSS